MAPEELVEVADGDESEEEEAPLQITTKPPTDVEVERQEESDSDSAEGDSLDGIIDTLKDRVSTRGTELSNLKKAVWNQDPDKRTIYVGHIDVSTHPDELYFDIFRECGPIKNIMIRTNPDGIPLGFAYVEFESVDGVDLALKKHKLNWRGLKLQVCPKVNDKSSDVKRMDVGLNLGVPLKMMMPPASGSTNSLAGKGIKGNPIMAGGARGGFGKGFGGKGGKGLPMSMGFPPGFGGKGARGAPSFPMFAPY
eukprot:TRINITY_DN14974_c0_g2_i1.p1 TRINITY_DN14974_c0_g2~~TRINITY_DN14974_c0_g2_i1.p1  ORF type:complete len:269 (+),score=96.00 TRINITY_DN14974_c0_g2_i1:54-809(+)